MPKVAGAGKRTFFDEVGEIAGSSSRRSPRDRAVDPSAQAAFEAFGTWLKTNISIGPASRGRSAAVIETQTFSCFHLIGIFDLIYLFFAVAQLRVFALRRMNSPVSSVPWIHLGHLHLRQAGFFRLHGG